MNPGPPPDAKGAGAGAPRRTTRPHAAAPWQRAAAWQALLARYGQVLRAAWSQRKELAGAARLPEEAAFLPAALSLQHTPVHPAPRRLAWALVCLVAAALAWACLGQLDIVAVASGRIVVGERTKLVQPLETSVVRRILVQDGDAVRAGQPLVELDPTAALADTASLHEQRVAMHSEHVRTAALLLALRDGEEEPSARRALRAEPGVTAAMTAEQKALHQGQLQAEWQDIRARRARFDAEARRREAEIATVQQAIAKLDSTLPMAQAREADFLQLVAQGYMSSHATQDKTRERIELERDRATQRARLAEARAALAETEQAKAAYLAETARQLNERHAQAASRRQQLDAELAKTARRERLTVLAAPPCSRRSPTTSSKTSPSSSWKQPSSRVPKPAVGRRPGGVAITGH